MFDFSKALIELKNNKKLARSGWNGKGMYVYLNYPIQNPHTPYYYLPFIMMKTADDKLVPWVVSQTDLLANDWRIVD